MSQHPTHYQQSERDLDTLAASVAAKHITEGRYDDAIRVIRMRQSQNLKYDATALFPTPDQWNRRAYARSAN